MKIHRTSPFLARRPLALWGNLILLGALLAACGEDGDATGDEAAQSYEFPSRFADGSSVSYSGQTARWVLLEALNDFVGGLDDAIDGGAIEVSQPGDLMPFLDFYFRFDSDSDGAERVSLDLGLPILQGTFNDISSGKDLVGKIAGNDPVTDHRVWTGDTSEFRGWTDPAIAAHGGSIDSPEGLFVALASTLEANATARSEGIERLGPTGARLPVTVTESGVDLQQMIEKFLLGAIAFSQGADDYLDNDVEGKGLLADNVEPAGEGAPYTALEHQWDEGFGYFGAARDYLAYTDEEIAGSGGRDAFAAGAHDSNGDGLLDLTSEVNFGLAVNAAKRDRDAIVPTDFSGDAMAAFLEGRALIADAGGALNDAELDALIVQRDRALFAWESALAATVVHYINETLQVMQDFDTDAYNVLEHAKVWSEMKGFALAFQFNPHSPVLADFDRFHALVGDAPVLPGDADAAAVYAADLLEARDLLGRAFAFDRANLGDERGENGW